ncbi:MAG TPA: hypothetical protein DCS07_14005 [Bdellovibrionales bacterium]|nr:hypothetical protein [Bdellovibrionales bacterium]HCM40836.1 hypothetical protein [Bdellovibrionales bacterium]
MKILTELQELGLVDFVDNHRAVRLHDDATPVQVQKIFLAICDLEGLTSLLQPISTKGILFGSRAKGRARSDSDYDLFIVSDNPEEAKKIAARHPLGKLVEVLAMTADKFSEMEKDDPSLFEKLDAGIVLWGSTW